MMPDTQLVFIINPESVQSRSEKKKRLKMSLNKTETFEKMVCRPKPSTGASTQIVTGAAAPHGLKRWHGGSTVPLLIQKCLYVCFLWRKKNECGSTSSGENRSACVVNICVTLQRGGGKEKKGQRCRWTAAFRALTLLNALNDSANDGWTWGGKRGVTH